MIAAEFTARLERLKLPLALVARQCVIDYQTLYRAIIRDRFEPEVETRLERWLELYERAMVQDLLTAIVNGDLEAPQELWAMAGQVVTAEDQAKLAALRGDFAAAKPSANGSWQLTGAAD